MSRAAAAGRRKESEPHISLPAPASCAPEMCQHVPPPPRTHPAAEVLEGLKHQCPGEVPLIFVYKGGKQKG